VGDAQLAHVVAMQRVLDLDHVGAEIRQHLSGPRPGEDPAKVENANMRQATGHGENSLEWKRRSALSAASPAGLTRGSIFFGRVFRKWMDCRVKPGNDGGFTAAIWSS
jgi:hypothetical protein